MISVSFPNCENGAIITYAYIVDFDSFHSDFIFPGIYLSNNDKKNHMKHVHFSIHECWDDEQYPFITLRLIIKDKIA